MAIILMNILAYFAILCLLGLIGEIVYLGTVANGFKKSGNKAIDMIKPLQNSTTGLVNAVRGVGLRESERFRSISRRLTTTAQHVGHVSNEVATAVKSIPIDDLRASMKSAADSFEHSGNGTNRFISEMIKTYLQANANRKK